MKFCKKCSIELTLGVNWTEARKQCSTYTCNSCLNIVSKKWRQDHEKEKKLIYKRVNLKQYGLSLEQYYLLVNKQENKCAICGKSGEDEIKSLHVDHDHNTGKIRGLLCNNCNTGLGKFKESVELLKKASIYLRQAHES